MKKLLVLIMVVVVTMTGCGEKTSIDTKQSSEVEQDELYNSAEKLSESQLQINCNGANNAMISFTDESVNKYLGGDNNYACSLFLSFGDDNLCNLRTDASKWYAYSGQCDSVTDEPIWFYDGESKLQKIEGNTISWEMSQEGIGDLLQKCDTYAIGFYANDSVDADFFTEGNAEVHVGDSKNSEGLEMLEVSDDLLIIRVKNTEAVNSHDQSGTLFITNFFDSEEDRECAHFNLVLTISEYNTVYAQSVEYDDNNCYIYHDITDDNGNIEIGQTINTDYGMAIQIKNSTVVSMVRNQLIYDINEDDNQSLYAMGYVADTKISIPAIPDKFPHSSEDDEYFRPITDDYVVSMVTYPAINWFDFGFSRDIYGNLFYLPVANHVSTAKVVTLISYDEFGNAYKQSKTIYENETEARTALIGRVQIDAPGLNGDEGEDDPKVKNLIDKFEQELISSSLSYIGNSKLFGSVRYFDNNIPVISAGMRGDIKYRENVNYDSEGYYTENFQYNYDFSDVSIGHSSILSDTATLVQYASKP